MSKQLFHLPSFAHVEQPPLERVREVFDKWLVLRSPTPIYGVLGDRFLLCRLEPASSNKQFDMALRHAGAATSVMRAELAAVVAELFARELREPRPLGRVEHARLRQVVGLAVRLRGGVERDR